MGTGSGGSLKLVVTSTKAKRVNETAKAAAETILPMIHIE
jgi:hypothetical protein